MKMYQNHYLKRMSFLEEKGFKFGNRKPVRLRVFRLSYVIVILTIIGAALFGCANLNGDKQETHNQKTYQKLDHMLQEWGKTFARKVNKEYQTMVNFKVPNTGTSYHIIIRDNQFRLSEGLNDEAYFTFKASMAHYNKIYRGEMTAFTSIGREKMSDATPLDMEFEPPVTADQMNDFMFFVQRFFNTTPYDKVKLGKDHSRIVHGGHAIPIFYRKNNEIGVRSAWYQINKGQQVNEPGDTNPFPQYFIIKKGDGYAKIGNDTLQVVEDEAYYIAPGSDHVFWTESEEPMEMIFLAWGKGA